jgi:hypothetical protein
LLRAADGRAQQGQGKQGRNKEAQARSLRGRYDDDSTATYASGSRPARGTGCADPGHRGLCAADIKLQFINTLRRLLHMAHFSLTDHDVHETR